MAELERIDDECDQKGISFVRIDNSAEAKEYGVDDLPALVYFEKGVPALYDGQFVNDLVTDFEFNLIGKQATCPRKRMFSIGWLTNFTATRLKMSPMKCSTCSSTRRNIWPSSSVRIFSKKHAIFYRYL